MIADAVAVGIAKRMLAKTDLIHRLLLRLSCLLRLLLRLTPFLGPCFACPEEDGQSCDGYECSSH